MGTQEKTVTGLYVRRGLAMRIWEGIRGLMGRRSQDWQPVVDCVRCQEQIEQRAAHCVYCGASQQPEAVLLPQTGAMQKLSTRQTEALEVPAVEVETKHLYTVRLGERHPAQQRLAEKRLYRWLYEQIEERYRDGATLVAASQSYGCHQYLWLQAKLESREALQLIEVFTYKCKKEDVVPFAIIKTGKAGVPHERPARRTS